ncbi:hypothetical protein [Desulfovibrio sp.]|uniref:hypothetical protein n=1 Tax=Desulfovibrio sp. TaxID=885 RepID=UPI003D1535D5
MGLLRWARVCRTLARSPVSPLVWPACPGLPAPVWPVGPAWAALAKPSGSTYTLCMKSAFYNQQHPGRPFCGYPEERYWRSFL